MGGGGEGGGGGGGNGLGGEKNLYSVHGVWRGRGKPWIEIFPSLFSSCLISIHVFVSGSGGGGEGFHNLEAIWKNNPCQKKEATKGEGVLIISGSRI